MQIWPRLFRHLTRISKIRLFVSSCSEVEEEFNYIKEKLETETYDNLNIGDRIKVTFHNFSYFLQIFMFLIDTLGYEQEFLISQVQEKQELQDTIKNCTNFNKEKLEWKKELVKTQQELLDLQQEFEKNTKKRKKDKKLIKFQEMTI